MPDAQATQTTGSAGGQARSTVDNIRQLTDASKQLLDAGKQMADTLSELSQRAEHATQLGSDVLKSPWFLAGGAVLAGALMLAFSRKHS